ncbi:MAG: hypothetical protein AAF203_02675, partial [Pseudomonadota bacterium]
RRLFCKSSIVALGGLALPFPLQAQSLPLPIPAPSDPADDHFFLQIIVQGGWNPTYLFDARPKEMTKNKLLVYALDEDPSVYQSINGTQCLHSSIVKGLLIQKDYFSVINGVLMATGFDGHGQNMNFLFSGNPFGGNSLCLSSTNWVAIRKPQ